MPAHLIGVDLEADERPLRVRLALDQRIAPDEVLLVCEGDREADSRLERVNLIVATGNNNWAMSEAVDSVAKTYIQGPDVSEGMLNRVEAAIRAYDPCLSCSTHAVGQMPLEVEYTDLEGRTLATVSR